MTLRPSNHNILTFSFLGPPQPETLEILDSDDEERPHARFDLDNKKNVRVLLVPFVVSHSLTTPNEVEERGKPTSCIRSCCSPKF